LTTIRVAAHPLCLRVATNRVQNLHSCSATAIPAIPPLLPTSQRIRIYTHTRTAPSPFSPPLSFHAGIGPELINGRLAMIGFVAALGAELSSGESVLTQWASEPIYIAGAFLLVIAGSLIPFLQGNKNTEALGALTPSAEMTNGRAAMIGFAALLAVEFANSGTALF
jgi:hypothetical protein